MNSYVEEVKRRLQAQQESETVILDGSRYKLFVLNDEAGNPKVYRLREKLNLLGTTKDFSWNDSDEWTDTDPLREALKEFDSGNELFDRLKEQAEIQQSHL